jgi:hypothetical protein
LHLGASLGDDEARRRNASIDTIPRGVSSKRALAQKDLVSGKLTGLKLAGTVTMVSVQMSKHVSRRFSHVLSASVSLFLLSLPLQGKGPEALPPRLALAMTQLGIGLDEKEAVENFVVERIFLAVGADTYLVRGKGQSGWCSPTGNCRTYIFQKEGKTYRVLMRPRTVQQVHVLNSMTNGYHDVQTDMHGSATQSGLSIYRYTGKEYWLIACFSREYSLVTPDRHEPFSREARSAIVDGKPRITRVSCR